MSNKEPTFEEGPFFLVVVGTAGGITTPQIGRRSVVWAADETAARQVFGMKTGSSIAYIYPELIGDLSIVKERFHLSSAQIADLHREGYLRL